MMRRNDLGSIPNSVANCFGVIAALVGAISATISDWSFFALMISGLSFGGLIPAIELCAEVRRNAIGDSSS